MAKHAHPHIGFPFPAGAICRTAARAFADIAEELVARGPGDIPTLMSAAQLSAAVLIAYSWEVKVTIGNAMGLEPRHAEEAVSTARRAMTVLDATQQRWPNARAML
jgi:hypothetical protein